jgi:ABC-type sugar transport system permease subunit
VNQKAWFLILPVILCVAFSAILPLMTVVNYSVQDIISPERRVFVGTEWFAAVMRDEELHARCGASSPSRWRCWRWRFRWASCWRCPCRRRAGRRRPCW